MGCDYHILPWIAQAFDELVATPVTLLTEEDEGLLGSDAFRALALAQAAVTDHRVTLAVCPPKPTHASWCHDTVYCTNQWNTTWTSTAGVLGWLIKDELAGAEIHDSKLEQLSVPGMTGECRLLTCGNIREAPGRRSVLKEEEVIIDEAIARLMRW
ncbi:hypothetical protein DFH06DRAFT_1195568 [Mycena polygramma]|nr:hypothetical protein DFH06DRAFT_1195568 [Mycena polygramma]